MTAEHYAWAFGILAALFLAAYLIGAAGYEDLADKYRAMRDERDHYRRERDELATAANVHLIGRYGDEAARPRLVTDTPIGDGVVLDFHAKQMQRAETLPWGS